MTKQLLTAIFSLIWIGSTFAQVGQGAIQGKVLDEGTGEPLPFANVVVMLNGVQQGGGVTDFDGKYVIKPIPPGKYTVFASFAGYQKKGISDVSVFADQKRFLDVKLTEGVALKAVEIQGFKEPLIDPGAGGKTTIQKEDIQRMAQRGAASIAATSGGTYAKDDGSGNLNVRGSRSDANYYYIDGIKVRGSTALPRSQIEQITVQVSGVSAQYGDVTGGVISITTTGPTSEYNGSLEYVTSGYKFGDKTYGLDPYAYNLLDFSASGPLIMKRDTLEGKDRPILSFSVGGQLQHVVDPRPSAIGVWKAKDEYLEELFDQPLAVSTNSNSQARVQSAEYTRLNDLEKASFRQNTAQQKVNLNGKLNLATTELTSLVVGGTFDYNKRNEDVRTDEFSDYALFNSENNPERIDQTWRVYARFTQRFKNPEEDENSTGSKIKIKNAFYNIQFDYTQDVTNRWDDSHKDNFFNYGHIGKFITYQDRDYTSNPSIDSTGQFFGFLQTTFVDTLIGFVPGEANPRLTKYTENYYESFGWEGYENGDDNYQNPLYDYEKAQDPNQQESNFPIRNFDNIQLNNGLVNGSLPQNVGNTWRAAGRQWNSYQTTLTNQYRLTGQGSADIGNHAILVGFEYEQRVDRTFSISPAGLWTLGRQLANNHIQNLDFSKPTLEYFQTYPNISYERLNSSPGEYDASLEGETQAFFDYNLRANTEGLETDGVDFVDFDRYDPSDLKLEYFSATELLDFYYPSGGMNYYGYDYTGQIDRNNYTIQEFFNSRDEFGNLTRPVGAFRPIYIAGFITDQFDFDDLHLNIGFRIDRFDANQPVLKDPYVLFPTVKAGELSENEIFGESIEVPGNIENDFVVYVDRADAPTQVRGYRDGDIWYDANGIQLDGPETIEAPTGPQPFLVDPTRTRSEQITEDAFEDYTPRIAAMPRVAFSFPISKEANFFAHYDILTQRPGANLQFQPLDYLYLQQIGSSITINNPNLSLQQTISYEVGFEQALNKTSAIKIRGFYRELRDLINLFLVEGGFPSDRYRTVNNIDFGTVKGTTIEYDRRRTGNIKLRAAYTLQFAEGTGSSGTSALGLVRAGLANLRVNNPLSYDQRHTILANVDYRYGSGSDYNGPELFGLPILQRTGANVQFNLGSGEPYSKNANVTGRALITGSPASRLEGSLFGSRLPWQSTIDLRFDRDFSIGKGENKKRKINGTVYIQVRNLLNALNIVDVYGSTGNPDDDGYLDEPRFDSDINSRPDPQSARELYDIAIYNPNNFALPRRTRLGIMLNF